MSYRIPLFDLNFSEEEEKAAEKAATKDTATEVDKATAKKAADTDSAIENVAAK